MCYDVLSEFFIDVSGEVGFATIAPFFFASRSSARFW
jgi:hypothetical protein